MVNDLTKDKWIDARLYVFNVHLNQVESAKSKLSSCTKELGWNIFTERHKDKIDIYASPKNRKISPLELEYLQTKITDAKNKIAKNFSVSINEGATIIQLVKEEDIRAKRNREMIKAFSGIIVLKFKLINRILLEEVNFPLANIVFRSSLYLDFEPKSKFRKTLNKFSKIAERNSRENIRKQMYDMCGITKKNSYS